MQEHLAQNITPPGSKPILIDSGAARATREVAVVTFSLTLYLDSTSFDESDIKAQLADRDDEQPHDGRRHGVEYGPAFPGRSFDAEAL